MNESLQRPFEPDPDSSETGTSKRKKRKKVYVPGLLRLEAEETGTDKSQKPSTGPWSELFARPSDEKAEKDKKEKSDTTQDNLTHDAVGDAAANSVQDETDAKADEYEESTESRDETYEQLPNRELPRTALNGGEVIIDLTHPVAEVPMFNRQPELQHQGRMEEPGAPTPAELPPVAEETADMPPAGPAEVPAATTEHLQDQDSPDESLPEASLPEQPPQAPEAAPMPEATAYQPAEIQQSLADHGTPDSGYVSVMAAPFRPAVPRPSLSEQHVVTKRQLDDAVYDATRTATSRGLVTGLTYEHFKHKRREKRQTKRMQQQGKQLEQARAEYRFASADQERKQAATERQLQTAEQRLDSARFDSRFGTVPAAAAAVERTTMPNGINPERSSERPASVRPEQLQPPADGKLEAPAEHRFETSAWHTIEVDAKTGKPVENPTFQYGHEYYRERAQENMPLTQRNAAAGEVAIVAASIAGSTGKGSSDAGGGGAAAGAGTGLPLPPAAIPSATTQGTPSRPPRTAAKNSSTSPGKTAPSNDQPLWPWLVALAVVIICIIIVAS